MTERGTRADEVLISMIARGDEAALGELYDRYSGLLFSLAAGILRSDADAEDVTAEVFSRAWSGASRFDPVRGSARAWLVTMTRSRSIDRLRARGRRQSAHERSASIDPEGAAVPLGQRQAADARLEHNRRREVMLEALQDLPDAQRTVIEMAYYGGLSQSEIAGELGEPLGTVKTRARAALQKLRASLGPVREVGR